MLKYDKETKNKYMDKEAKYKRKQRKEKKLNDQGQAKEK